MSKVGSSSALCWNSREEIPHVQGKRNPSKTGLSFLTGLSFKPTFSLSSSIFIKRLFSSSSLSAIRVVSSAYLRLLIFLPAILIPACVSSSPITSWQIDGETMKTVRDFNFLGSEITPDGGCSHEIKRCLLLGRKALANLDSIFKEQKHYFANKGPSSLSCGFSSSHLWM